MRTRHAARLPRLLDGWRLIVIAILTSTAPAWANESGGCPAPGLGPAGR
jgi:hypothetical protein